MEQRTPAEAGAAHGRRAGASRPLDEIGSEVSHQVDELRGRLDETLDRAAELIRQRPGAALVVALGVGYLIGRIVRS